MRGKWQWNQIFFFFFYNSYHIYHLETLTSASEQRWINPQRSNTGTLSPWLTCVSSNSYKSLGSLTMSASVLSSQGRDHLSYILQGHSWRKLGLWAQTNSQPSWRHRVHDLTWTSFSSGGFSPVPFTFQAYASMIICTFKCWVLGTFDTSLQPRLPRTLVVSL